MGSGVSPAPKAARSAQSALAGVRGQRPRENFELLRNRNLEIALEKWNGLSKFRSESEEPCIIFALQMLGLPVQSRPVTQSKLTGNPISDHFCLTNVGVTGPKLTHSVSGRRFHEMPVKIIRIAVLINPKSPPIDPGPAVNPKMRFGAHSNPVSFPVGASL